MLTSKQIIEKIENNIEKIKKFGVSKIGIFGSFSRNQQKPGSDIDIIVEFEKPKKTFDNYMDLKFFLEEIFGSKVDLVLDNAVKKELRPYIMESVIYASGI
ncbi:MAG: nucleotidyltransferase family protein [Candidatus Helarchaeota archaeon]